MENVNQLMLNIDLSPISDGFVPIHLLSSLFFWNKAKWSYCEAHIIVLYLTNLKIR